MRPYRGFQLRRFHRSASTRAFASADDAILAVAGVVLARWLGLCRHVRSSEHRQPTCATRNQATKQVVVVRVASEREQRVARELFLRALGDRSVEDGWYSYWDPLLTRSWLAAACFSGVRSARSTRPLGWHVAVPVGVGGTGVDWIGQDMVHRRGGPWQATTPRSMRSEVETLQDLPNAHALVDQPAIHHADQFRLGVIDDQVAWDALAFGHVSVTVGSPAAQIHTGSRALQLAAAESLSEQGSLVLGDGALDLEQELVARVFSDRPMYKDYLATGSLELLEQQHLIDVLASEAIWTEDDNQANCPVLDGITQTIQSRSVESRPAVALVQEHVLGLKRVAVGFGPRS
jgi:hypothetical protein